MKVKESDYNKFYCPVCLEDIKLRLGADPVAKCIVCRWTSGKVTDLNIIEDMKERDLRPWPTVDSAIGVAVLRWKGRQKEEQENDITRLRFRQLIDNMSTSTVRWRGDDESMRGLSIPEVEDTEYEESVPRRMRIPDDRLVLAANVRRREQLPPSRNLAVMKWECYRQYTTKN